MSSRPEGLAIARERIAEEKEKRTGFLDLGGLGLEELPEELFELEHLSDLNWGSGWIDEQGEWQRADPDLAPNWHTVPLIGRLQRFPRLRLLSVSGTNLYSLGPLAHLRTLQSLNCSETPVSDLPGPLVWLESLKSLFLFNTHITHIPARVLSPDYDTNCLESLRAYLRAADGAPGPGREP